MNTNNSFDLYTEDEWTELFKEWEKISREEAGKAEATVDQRVSYLSQTLVPDLSSMWIDEGDCTGDTEAQESYDRWLCDSRGDSPGWHATPTCVPETRPKVQLQEQELLGSGGIGQGLPRELPSMQEPVVSECILYQGGEFPLGERNVESEGHTLRKRDQDGKRGKATRCFKCARDVWREEHQRQTPLWRSTNEGLERLSANGVSQFGERFNGVRTTIQLGQVKDIAIIRRDKFRENDSGRLTNAESTTHEASGSISDPRPKKARRYRIGRHVHPSSTRRGANRNIGLSVRHPGPCEVQSSDDSEDDAEDHNNKQGAPRDPER